MRIPLQSQRDEPALRISWGNMVVRGDPELGDTGTPCIRHDWCCTTVTSILTVPYTGQLGHGQSISGLGI